MVEAKYSVFFKTYFLPASLLSSHLVGPATSPVRPAQTSCDNKKTLFHPFLMKEMVLHICCLTPKPGKARQNSLPLSQS